MDISWSHAVVRVRDVNAMALFYEDLLGFKVADRGSLGPPGGGGAEIIFMSGMRM